VQLSSRQRLNRTIAGAPVDRPPVWIMRQAGRTLPEYRLLRERHPFWEVCKSPELAAQVTLQPLHRFDLDAAVIFSDILVVPAAMGMDVQLEGGLSLAPPIRDRSDLRRLTQPVVARELGFVGDVVAAVRREVGDTKGVLGFAGAPYTLARYMVEGGGTRHCTLIKSLFMSDPELGDTLLELLADLVSDLLLMQVAAGADAVQIFDSWAEELSPEEFRRFALPPVRRIVERLGDTPVIYYVNGIGNVLEDAATSGAAVLGIDWRVELSTVRRRVGDDRVLQGNLDPSVMLCGAEEVRHRTQAMLSQTGGMRHIANLGHGILPETPIASIGAFVEAVTQWRNPATVAASWQPEVASSAPQTGTNR